MPTIILHKQKDHSKMFPIEKSSSIRCIDFGSIGKREQDDNKITGREADN